MREYKTFEETVTRQVCTKVVCDLCGAEGRELGNEVQWEKTTYDAATTIFAESGARWPDSAQVETTRFDVCPNCFKTKLVPWMKSQGATPTISEINY